MEVVALLRALGAEVDTVATVPAAALSHIHMDPDRPVACLGDHTMLAALPDRAIEELVMTAGEHSGSPLLLVDLRQLGGALAHAPAESGALGKLDGAFAVTAIGMALNDPMAAAVDTHLALLTDALAPWDAGSRYLNFVDRPGDPAHGFTPPAYRRPREVKAAYDPNDLFLGNHRITASR